MAPQTLTIAPSSEVLHHLPATDGDTDLDIRVERDATLTAFVPVWGGVRHRRIRIHLAAPGARATLLGLVIGNTGDRATLDIETIHEARDTEGFTNVRAVLDGDATFQFDGMIRIQPGAHGSRDILDEDALLLSRRAYANAVPALEIEADDVRATHAATVGQLDEEQLFYLMSRGLVRDEATRLIVSGFVDVVLRDLPDGPVKQAAERDLATLFTRP